VSRASGGLRLFLIYAVVSLVPILVLGLVFGSIIRNQIADRAQAEAVLMAETIVDSGVEPILNSGDFQNGLTPSERDAMVHMAAALIAKSDLLRMRIRSPDGTILFDPRNPDAPIVPIADAEVALAAANGPTRMLTHVGADSVDGTSTSGVEAVEAYLPFTDPNTGEVIGVLEIYLAYAPFQASAARDQRTMLIALGFGMLSLWILLGVTTWWAPRLRRSAKQNEWLARHDQLTGLPNRLGFAEVLATHADAGAHLSVAVIDIAKFGTINDTMGHDNADEYLCRFGAVLRDAVPEEVIVGRMAGDQFGVVALDLGLLAFEELLKLIAVAAAARIQIGGIELSAELAIGYATSDDAVVTYDGFDHVGAELTGAGDGVLRAAEFALRAAKESGLSPLSYTPEFDRFDPLRLALAGELGAAIAAGEMVLHYQPILDLKTGVIRSVEALVRWQHPTRGLIPPDEFIPIAESTSLMRPLTEWVIRTAVDQAAHWRDMNFDFAVSVNISARSLFDRNLPELIIGVVTAASLPPEKFKVEVTETAIVADPVRARELLGRLHDAGVRVSLDDFGQGATSLMSITNLPLDELKVDRQFVTQMTESDDHRAVVEFVVSLGHRLGLTVVAEGIETEAAAATLTEIGCDEGQGYLYSRPIAEAEFESWLVGHHSWAVAPPR